MTALTKRKIHLYKAASIGEHEITDIEILIGPEEFPEVTAKNWEKVAKDVFELQAISLYEVLGALPGGTLDRLLLLLLEKKASLFRVPLWEVPTPPKQSATSDFKTIIQGVLCAAAGGGRISLDESTTERLAAEIRKLLERP